MSIWFLCFICQFSDWQNVDYVKKLCQCGWLFVTVIQCANCAWKSCVWSRKMMENAHSVHHHRQRRHYQHQHPSPYHRLLLLVQTFLNIFLPFYSIETNNNNNIFSFRYLCVCVCLCVSVISLIFYVNMRIDNESFLLLKYVFASLFYLKCVIKIEK